MVKKRVYTREISENEFLKLKKLKPFSDFRQDAKACFHKDTLVCMEEGVFRIEDIVPPTLEGFTPSFGLKFKTPSSSIEEADATYFSHTKEWIEFTLSNGDTFKVTPDHQMVVWRDGIRISCEAKDVKDTDCFEAE